MLTTQKNSKVRTRIQGIVDNNILNLAIRQREADITKERVEKILASGANVILTTGGIDDLNTKYFVEKGAMGVRRVLKKDLKRIAKATGGKRTIIFSITCLSIKMIVPCRVLWRKKTFLSSFGSEPEMLTICYTPRHNDLRFTDYF